MAASRRRPRGLHRARGRSLDAFLTWSNSPAVTGWLCVLAASLCLSGAFLAHRHASTFRERGIQAQADVLGMVGDRTVRLRFTTARGQEITTEVGALDWSPAPVAGGTAKVIYDPADPTGSVIGARSASGLLPAWVLLGLAALFGCLAVPSFAGRLRWSAQP